MAQTQTNTVASGTTQFKTLISSAQTTIDVVGLDGDSAKRFSIEFQIKKQEAGGGILYLELNADTANHADLLFVWSTGFGLGGGTHAYWYESDVSGANTLGAGRGTILTDRSGGRVRVSSDSRLDLATSTTTYNTALDGIYTPSGNITSVRLRLGSGNFAAGSYLAVRFDK